MQTLKIFKLMHIDVLGVLSQRETALAHGLCYDGNKLLLRRDVVEL